MSMWARLHNFVGGSGRTWNITVTGLTTLNIPDPAFVVNLTGTATIATLVADNAGRNRMVTFIQQDTGTTTFTSSTSLILGGDIALTNNKQMTLYYQQDGTWVLMNSTAI